MQPALDLVPKWNNLNQITRRSERRGNEATIYASIYQRGRADSPARPHRIKLAADDENSFDLVPI